MKGGFFRMKAKLLTLITAALLALTLAGCE